MENMREINLKNKRNEGTVMHYARRIYCNFFILN